MADETRNISRNEENDPFDDGDGRLTASQFVEHLLRDLIVYPFRQGYQMPHPDFAIVYSGASFQADLLKSLLEGKGIRAILADEFLGRIVPYAVPGGVKVLVANADVDKARRIVEDFIKDSTA